MNSALVTPLLLSISDRQDLFSMAYVRAVVATAGFNFGKSELDRNSDDLQIELLQPENSFSQDFSPAYGRLQVQVKCTYAHDVKPDGYIHFPLPIRNYNQLRAPKIEPKILVVVLVPRPEPHPKAEPWIECVNQHTVLRYRAYWVSIMGAESKDGQDTVTVKVPTSKPFDVDTVRFLMTEMVMKGNKKL